VVSTKAPAMAGAHCWQVLLAADEEATMIFKIIVFVAAAIPIFLLVRSIFFRQPTRINEGFKEFKKQSDLAVSIFLFLIGCVVIFAAGKLVWTWL
jgi:hypothetical protein